MGVIWLWFVWWIYGTGFQRYSIERHMSICHVKSIERERGLFGRWFVKQKFLTFDKSRHWLTRTDHTLKTLKINYTKMPYSDQSHVSSMTILHFKQRYILPSSVRFRAKMMFIFLNGPTPTSFCLFLVFSNKQNNF